MARFGIGQPVRRVEDPKLLLGRGRFVDDLCVPDAAHGFVLRSPHAHAEIVSMDTAPARAMAGVLLAATAGDLAEDGVGDIPAVFKPAGVPFNEAPMPVLARGRVRYAGEPVAFIVAETPMIARDAAEAISIEWKALPASTQTGDAKTAPRLHENAAGNVCFHYEAGDKAATDEAFARAPRRVALELVNNRMVVHAMEPRAAIGIHDGARFTLHANTQVPHRFKTLTAAILGVPAESVRVIVGDVGGGFGAKNQLYSEQVLVLWAARRLGRPVKWIGTNGEGFLSDIQGRDNVTHGELAFDRDGRFLALRARTAVGLGAYVANMGALIPTVGLPALAGSYRMDAAHAAVDAVFTNAPRTDAFRGAGTPEANYVIERLVDAAAHELGVAPAELRRRNLVRPGEMPRRTAFDLEIDVGDFPRRLNQALKLIGDEDFAARRAEARKRGLLRGLGVASIIEKKGGGFEERSTIRFDAEGRAEVLSGMMANGQGHETTFAQIVAERLGLDFADIRVVQGDTDVIATGLGTAGSRSMILGGSSLHRAIDRAIEKGMAVAAHLLETAAADITFEAARYTVAGTDRSVTFKEVARAARDPAKRPPDGPDSLDAEESFQSTDGFPNSCHAAEVEVDPETGVVALVRYAVAQDSGTVLNPLLLEGQIHGGLAQGVGQALLEHVVFDPETAQPLAASLMDYALPRADDFPDFAIVLDGVPTKSNPLGVKGVGESGCTGAPPAVVNAVLDALRPLGVTHLDMPLTPQRVWGAIRAASRR